MKEEKFRSCKISRLEFPNRQIFFSLSFSFRRKGEGEGKKPAPFLSFAFSFALIFFPLPLPSPSKRKIEDSRLTGNSADNPEACEQACSFEINGDK